MDMEKTLYKIYRAIDKGNNDRIRPELRKYCRTTLGPKLNSAEVESGFKLKEVLVYPTQGDRGNTFYLYLELSKDRGETIVHLNKVVQYLLDLFSDDGFETDVESGRHNLELLVKLTLVDL